MVILRVAALVSRGTFFNPALPAHQFPRLKNTLCKRYMASVVKDDIPHLERTAKDARQQEFYHATITRVEQVNKSLKTVRLSLSKTGPRLRHLPGQYVDLYIPNISVVGGFTITSPPHTSLLHPVCPTTNLPIPVSEDPTFPYLELSIQAAAANPPAAYIWQDPEAILGAPVSLRIGGNFHHPPAALSLPEFKRITNIVFIAGGVGINPVISMVSTLDLAGPGALGGLPRSVSVLYASKRSVDERGEDERILFEDRLQAIENRYKGSDDVLFKYRLFETGTVSGRGRITRDDLMRAVGGVEERRNTLVYVCGVPKMTDEFVEFLRGLEGLDENRVLCEKWW